jgi:hypothetical protein
MALDYNQWLAWQAQQVQNAGGTAPLYPQPVTTPAQVTPGFGIAGTTGQPVADAAQPQQPANMVFDQATGQWIPRPAPPVGAPQPGPMLAQQQTPLTPQQAQQRAQQGGQTPSSPTGFGLPPAGWRQSPAANQQYAQFGQMGAAAGQQGGQYGYLGATNSQLPAGTAAGAWSSSPQPAARGVAAPARVTPSIVGQRTAAQPLAAATPVRYGATATPAAPTALNPGSTGVGTAPQTLQAYGAAMPTPNKIVGRNFTKLDPDTQDFLRSGYRAQGYSDNQVNQAVKQGLPQFKLPGGTGTVR